MAIQRCPECDLLMTDEEAGAGCCRSCQGKHHRDEASARTSRRLMLLLALVAVAAGVAVLTMWLRGGLGVGGVTATGLDQPIAPSTRPSPAPQGARMAAMSVALDQPILAATHPPAPKAAVAGGDKPRVVNKPDGTYTVDSLLDGAVLKLTGRVKTLVIGRVDGHSQLDASGLQAREIQVRENIDGESTVKLHAPDGFVRLGAKVDGGSKLDIDAPGGLVWFRPIDGRQRDIRIDGESTVKICGRQVKLPPLINGTRTRVDVTLSKNGELKWGAIAGQVKLNWRKSDRNDPEPKIIAGSVTPGATVARQ